MTPATKPLRYRVRAWAAEGLPDIEMETNRIPRKLLRLYPCTSIALLQPVSVSALNRALDKPARKRRPTLRAPGDEPGLHLIAGCSYGSGLVGHGG